ncbi:MAG: hypothetical protein AAGI46_04305 [Planctomycetota bacterium]
MLAVRIVLLVAGLLIFVGGLVVLDSLGQKFVAALIGMVLIAIGLPGSGGNGWHAGIDFGGLGGDGDGGGDGCGGGCGGD